MKRAQALELAVLRERVNGDARALALQSEEYHRRLDELNHAHALAQEKEAEFVQRREFGVIVDELRTLAAKNEDRVGTLERAASNVTGRNAAIAGIGGLGLSIISALVGHAFK